MAAQPVKVEAAMFTQEQKTVLGKLGDVLNYANQIKESVCSTSIKPPNENAPFFVHLLACEIRRESGKVVCYRC